MIKPTSTAVCCHRGAEQAPFSETGRTGMNGVVLAGMRLMFSVRDLAGKTFRQP
jgi:hypothetical protein